MIAGVVLGVPSRRHVGLESCSRCGGQHAAVHVVRGRRAQLECLQCGHLDDYGEAVLPAPEATQK